MRIPKTTIKVPFYLYINRYCKFSDIKNSQLVKEKFKNKIVWIKVIINPWCEEIHFKIAE